MKQLLKPLAFIAISIFIFYSCSKSSNNECVGGKGGDHSVAVKAKHDTLLIINYESHPDTAFVKYNTLVEGTLPAVFDTFYVSEAGEDHIHCEGLKCGNYFIYRTAWDSLSGNSYHAGFGISIDKNVQEIDTTITVN